MIFIFNPNNKKTAFALFANVDEIQQNTIRIKKNERYTVQTNKCERERYVYTMNNSRSRSVHKQEENESRKKNDKTIYIRIFLSKVPKHDQVIVRDQ